MVDVPFSLTYTQIVHVSPYKSQKSVSYRSLTGKNSVKSLRSKSQERFSFNHQLFTHPKIVKGSHNILLGFHRELGNKLQKDHSRTVIIKKRLVSENILLDSFSFK